MYLGGYPYSYGYGMGGGAAVGFVSVLTVIAVLAIIGLSIVGYYKFLGKHADRRTKMGRFFNFDHFFLEKILKVVYLISVVFVTVAAVATPIGMAVVAGVGGFFSGLLSGVLMFIIGQFLCRISFELQMMFVRLVTDTRAIRVKVAGDPADEQRGGLYGAGGAAGGVPGVGAGATGSGAPVPPAAATWDCSCGNRGNAGKFCARCGSPRP